MDLSALSLTVEKVARLRAFPSLDLQAWRGVEDSTEEVLASAAGLAQAPGGVELLSGYASILYARGDESGAEEVWTALFEALGPAGPPDAAAFCATRLARCAMDFDEPAVAERWLKKARARASHLPGDHVIQHKLGLESGVLAASLGDWEEARSNFAGLLARPMADAGETKRWEGLGPSELRAIEAGAFADCLMEEARSSAHRDALLARAEDLLREAQHRAETHTSRFYTQINLAELLCMRGESHKAATLASGVLALSMERGLDAVTAAKWQPCARWVMGLVSMSAGDLAGARNHLREAFVALRRWRSAASKRILVRTLLDVFRHEHQARYGISSEDTVLRTLEGDGSWLLALADFEEISSVPLVPKHSRHVDLLCIVLYGQLFRGQEETWTPRELDASYLHGAALFHDIGNLHMPWSLLRRVRPPAAKHVKRLQRHVSAGAEILESVGLPMTARLLEEHHERADGSGYPSGLARPTTLGGILALAEGLVTRATPSAAVPAPPTHESAAKTVLQETWPSFHPQAVGSLRRAAESGALLALDVALRSDAAR